MIKGSYFAFVDLYVGSTHITSTSDHFIDMLHKRVDKAISTSMIFTIYDDSALVVEAEILKGSKDIRFSYGYQFDSYSRQSSPVYTGTLIKYNIDFVESGVELTIEAAMNGIEEVVSSSSETFSEMRIDEIVSYLAGKNNWTIGAISECIPIYENDKLEQTVSNYKKFSMNGMSAQSFIEEKLVPLAVSTTGSGGYSFRLEKTDSGSICYFVPSDWKQSEVVTSYTYVMGGDSENIISFTPEFGETLSALVGTNVVMESMDPYTNEFKSVFVGESDTSLTKRVLGSSYSYSEMKALSTNIYGTAKDLSYKATMILRGDLSVEPMSVIKLAVLTKEGFIHHSSGEYLITSVQDDIVEGSFRTTLALLKNYQNLVNSSSNVSGDGSLLYNTSEGYSSVPDTVPNTNLLQIIKDKYLGIPYFDGGLSVQTGCDSVGLNYLVMKEFGVDMGKTYSEQKNKGSEVAIKVLPFKIANVALLSPGDIIFDEVSSYSVNSSSNLSVSDPNWKQYDSRWANDVMQSDTLRESGCLVTSISILMKMTGKVDSSFSPAVLNKYLRTHNGYAGGDCFVWSSTDNYIDGWKHLGGGSAFSEIKSKINSGYYVVISVKNGGHWVAGLKVSGDDIVISDPGSSSTSLRSKYGVDNLSYHYFSCSKVNGTVSSGETKGATVSSSLPMYTAYAVNNPCYKEGRTMTPKGIVVHSTGCENPYLKRYVDMPSVAGLNTNGNHWNTSGTDVCVHSFIGLDKNNNLAIVNILPYNYCCWGVGAGSKGSYNYNPPYIQFEICEDDTNDESYCRKCFEMAARYCAYLSQRFNLPVSNIVSHKEANDLGYGSAHGDPNHWFSKFGITMDAFRSRVKSLLGGSSSSSSNLVQNTVSGVTQHSAIYLGGNYVFQTNSSVGSSHFAKLSAMDLLSIDSIRRVIPSGKIITNERSANSGSSHSGSAGGLDLSRFKYTYVTVEPGQKIEFTRTKTNLSQREYEILAKLTSVENGVFDFSGQVICVSSIVNNSEYNNMTIWDMAHNYNMYSTAYIVDGNKPSDLTYEAVDFVLAGGRIKDIKHFRTDYYHPFGTPFLNYHYKSWNGYWSK